jgi:pimeloyl-ACP methyl ester carboxylesterase
LRIALRGYGEGPHLTLCLHGFLEDSASFAALAEALPGHRLLAPDMPFHGLSEWDEDGRLRPEDLIDILMQCPELQKGRFGLLGYSMGGKTALSLFERMPERISHLVLVAPDGLRPDPWHAFFTRTLLGNHILRYTMQDPRWFNVLLDTLRRVRLVNESLYRFTLSYLGDADIRRRVYRVWMTLREIRPQRERLPDIIRSHRTPVRLVFGRYDRLCPVRIGEDFVRRLDGLARMDILESGHLLLRGKHARSLAESFPTLPAN